MALPTNQEKETLWPGQLLARGREWALPGTDLVGAGPPLLPGLLPCHRVQAPSYSGQGWVCLVVPASLVPGSELASVNAVDKRNVPETCLQ